MCPVLAELMGKVAFPPVGTEIKTDFIFEFFLWRQSFGSGGAGLDVKEAHLETLVRKVFPLLLTAGFIPVSNLL